MRIILTVSILLTTIGTLSYLTTCIFGVIRVFISYDSWDFLLLVLGDVAIGILLATRTPALTIDALRPSLILLAKAGAWGMLLTLALNSALLLMGRQSHFSVHLAPGVGIFVVAFCWTQLLRVILDYSHHLGGGSSAGI